MYLYRDVLLKMSLYSFWRYAVSKLVIFQLPTKHSIILGRREKKLSLPFFITLWFFFLPVKSHVFIKHEANVVPCKVKCILV